MLPLQVFEVQLLSHTAEGVEPLAWQELQALIAVAMALEQKAKLAQLLKQLV